MKKSKVQADSETDLYKAMANAATDDSEHSWAFPK